MMQIHSLQAANRSPVYQQFRNEQQNRLPNMSFGYRGGSNNRLGFIMLALIALMVTRISHKVLRSSSPPANPPVEIKQDKDSKD